MLMVIVIKTMLRPTAVNVIAAKLILSLIRESAISCSLFVGFYAKCIYGGAYGYRLTKYSIRSWVLFISS